MKKIILIYLILFWFIPFLTVAQKNYNIIQRRGEGSIFISSHNLSTRLIDKKNTAGNASDVCGYCHTFHTPIPMNPMWNKKSAGQNYILYNSSTLQALPGQPDGASILCLSCHDGTIATGNINNNLKNIIDFTSSDRLLQNKYNLTKDLSDDHPISFIYDANLAVIDGHLKDPSVIISPIKLDDQKMQCTTCHDPHYNGDNKFLTVSNKYSELCLECHNIDDWISSSHSNSGAIWNGLGLNPWFHTPYNNVAENACENCHNPHNAEGKLRLLNYAAEESNCLHCHNGNVASKNIESQLIKPYNHNVYEYNLVHDLNEQTMPSVPHVECVDCHNPHFANSGTAVAPFVKGANEGVIGVNQNGIPVNKVQNEYEICFRCHSDNQIKSTSLTIRELGQNNVRLDFDPANISFHPVIEPRNNVKLNSLIDPLTTSSIIYCTDCHASDGAGSPAGPHGSIYPQILKANYNRNKSTNLLENVSASTLSVEFALCAECHNMNEVKNSHQSMQHVLSLTSCNTCHDPHGFEGGNEEHNSFLVNMDTDLIFPNSDGERYIQMNGNGTGKCFLRCHDTRNGDFNFDHRGADY